MFDSYEASLRHSAGSRGSAHSGLSSSGGRESVDLMRDGINYYHYSLTEDFYLSCPVSEDILVKETDKVIVIDKDTDG